MLREGSKSLVEDKTLGITTIELFNILRSILNLPGAVPISG